MNRIRNALAGALLATFFAAPAWSRSDSQIWTTGTATVNIGGPWRLQEDLVGRFSDNRGGLYEIESNTLLGYRFANGITLWGGYTHDPQYSHGEHTVTEHRAREQVTFDKLTKIGSATLSGRLRLEQRWRPNADGTGWRFRPYLKLAMPLKGKTNLNLSTEPFIDLNTTSFQTTQGFERMRNLISISTPLTKHLNGEAGYMNQYSFVRNGEDNSDNIAYFAVSLNL